MAGPTAIKSLLPERIVRLEWPLAFASLSTYLAAGMAGEVSPVLMGAVLDDLGLSATRGGFVFSVEMFVIAVVTLSSGPFMGVVNRTRLAYGATALIILGALGAMLSTNLESFMAARLLAGIGEGLMFSIGTCILGAAREPERVSALTATMQPLATMATLMAIPLLAVQFGRSGGYGLLAALACLSFFAYRFIPRAPREGAPLREALSGIARGHGDPLSVKAPPLWLPTVLIGTWLFSVVGEFGAYIFVERKAQSLGMSPELIGLALTTTAATGLVGAALASALGRRLGRVVPYMGGLTMAASGVFITYSAESTVQYFIGMGLWGAGFFIAFPYKMGVMAMLDVEGRWVALSTGITMVAVAAAPTVLGQVIDSMGFAGVQKLSPSLMSITIVLGGLAVFAAGRFEKSRDNV